MPGPRPEIKPDVALQELLSLAFEQSSHPQFVSRADGSIILANPAYAEFIGSSQEAVIGTGPADITHPDDLDLLIDTGLRLFRGEIAQMHVEARLRRADNEMRICTVSTVLAHNPRGKPLYVTQIEDVTSNRMALQQLKASQSRFQTLSDSVPVGIVSRDYEGRLTYVNDRWSEITGIPATDAIGRRLAAHIYPADRPQVLEQSLKFAETGGIYKVTYRVLRPDGSLRWVVSSSLKIAGTGDERTSYVGSIEDITDLVTAQTNANRLATILETTSDLVWIINEAWLVTWSNATARAAFGLDHLPLPIAADLLYTAESLAKMEQVIRPQLLRGENWVGELEMNGVGGAPLWIRQSLSPQFDPIENTNSIAALAHDASERREMGELLAHQANHDPLTGLPNRALLLERLTAAIAARRAPDATIAVLFLDVDNFKLVNDRFGHQVGDQLLCVIAERLSSVLRSTDLVGRIGGDEFVIVCPNLPHQGPAEDTARRTLAAVSQTPISADGHLLSITASVGITLLTEDRDVGPETLIREADTAMYTAKSLGRNRVESFDRTVRVAHPNQEPAPTVHP